MSNNTRYFKWTEEVCIEAYHILCEYPQNLQEGCRKVLAHFGLNRYKKQPSAILYQTNLKKYLETHPIVKILSGDERRLIIGKKNQPAILLNGETIRFRASVQFVSLQNVRYEIVRD